MAKQMMCPDYPQYEDCIDCRHASSPHDEGDDCTLYAKACADCVPYKSSLDKISEWQEKSAGCPWNTAWTCDATKESCTREGCAFEYHREGN